MLQAVCIDSMFFAWNLKNMYTCDKKKSVYIKMTMSSFNFFLILQKSSMKFFFCLQWEADFFIH